MSKSIAELENKIDYERDNLIQMIKTWSPVELMFSVAVQARMACSNLNDTSIDNLAIARSAEYIQSLYSSYAIQTDQVEKRTISIKEIMDCIIRIYTSCTEYEHLYFESKFQCFPSEESQLLFQYESQLLKRVRGHRYTTFHNQFFNNLLKSHESEFRKLFGIGTKDIVRGILQLEKTLRTAVEDWFSLINKAFEKQYIPQLNKSSLLEKFNIKLVTNWPDELIKALSWEIGESKSFSTRAKYSGWPNVELPTQMRPFIMVGGEYYCFDYYTFVDNIYRAIAKAVVRLDSTYRWPDYQSIAAEEFAAKLITKLLAGATIYRNVFYRLNRSKKTTAESDIIAIYDNTIVFAEVKAGAYDYVAPIDDLDGHIKSLGKLMGDPAKQSMRAQENLLSSDEFNLYDSKGTLITTIDATKLKHSIRMAITVDNINTVASHIGQYQFVEGADNAICISLDELMVYSDLFDSPLVFLHFMFQRQQATKNTHLVTSDELDHLALYFRDPHYWRKGEGEENTTIFPSGFVQEIDEYYYSQQREIDRKNKPQPHIPALIVDILKVIDKSQSTNRVEVAMFLLDFNYEEREEFACCVGKMREKITSTRKCAYVYTCPIVDSKYPYAVFISAPGLPVYTARKEEEILSQKLSQDKYSACWIFTIRFKGVKIDKVDFKLLETV